MHMRKGTSADYPAILELFNKLSWDYKFPDIDELVDIQVVVDDNDVIQMVLAGKQVVEYNLLINPESNLTPFEKWEYLKTILNLSFANVKKSGFKQVFAFLPPELSKSFGRRMLKIGATLYTWPVFGKDI